MSGVEIMCALGGAAAVGFPVWFITSLHWYRKGLRDARDIWAGAVAEASESCAKVARDTIDSWITKSEEMVARHRKGGSPAGGSGDGE